MSFDLVAELKSLLSRFEAAPAVQTVETDVKDIASASWNWLKTNGMQDVYQIALTLVGGALPGASWMATIASVEAQAVTDGIALVKGTGAIAAAQAQADLIAAGKLLPPAAPAA